MIVFDVSEHRFYIIAAFFPFEQQSWELFDWANGLHPSYPDAYHGDNYHQCADYYAEDWSKVAAILGPAVGPNCEKNFNSPLEGTVIFVENGVTPSCVNNNATGLGNQVIIQASNNPNFAFRISHLYSVSNQIQLGSTVNIGDYLGKVGATGTIDAHAHCVLYKNIFIDQNFPAPLGAVNMYDFLVQGASWTNDSSLECASFLNYAAEFRFDASGTGGTGGTSSLAENESNDLIIEIFPNPSLNNIIYVKSSYSLDVNAIQFLDTQGKILDFFAQPDNTFVLTDVSAGVYYMKYEKGSISAIQKFVVF